MKSFLFYDIETTGLNKSFDQVLHFAAIRTDKNLKELDRHDIKVRLNPDIIPSPNALKTHQIGIKASHEGLPEIDAIKHIHALMNTSGTMSVGYNTLGFDDEFLRFSFYRNLLPPYTHQYANQCGRMDLYPMAVMYFLFKRSVLTWPEKNNRTSLKLEDLNKANQFISGRAHHAMVDVEVTLALAKRFLLEQDMWDFLMGYFDKSTDQKRLLELPHHQGLMIDGIFGAHQFYQCPVLFLGNHHYYKNQTLWLRLDSDTLAKTTPETISQTTWVIHKKLGEPGFVLPLKDRFLQYLTHERSTLVESNIKWLHEHPQLFSDIVNFHANYCYPVYPETDIDACLYINGFWSKEEAQCCRHFHTVKPSEKAVLTQKIKNLNLKSLAIRLLGRHYPDVMMPEQCEQFNRYLQKINPENDADILIDFRGEKRLTPKAALTEIETLIKNEPMTDHQLHLFSELKQYLIDKFH